MLTLAVHLSFGSVRGDIRKALGANVSNSDWLHCALAAARYIVIGPVCGSVGGWVCYHYNSKFVCIDPHKTHLVGESSDHLQLTKFWPSCAPGRGSVAGRKFSAPPYYSQRAVFASL